MKRLILIDAHAVIHRAYHALPPLTTPAGEPINAVYGFTTMLMRILRELKPDYIVAAFDLPGPTFRHIAYERYKAQRPETPSDLSSQFIKVREVLDAFNISRFEKEGFEADDIIGTIAKKLENKKDLENIIVTGDMDALQLVRKGLKVYAMKKGITETTIYNEKAVEERYGLKPGQLIDFKGLKGDPSDNIPGVKGIGEKTAGELIQKFGSIGGVYRALRKGNKKITASVAEKLKAGKEDAKFSRELSVINTKVPIKIDLEDWRWKEGEGEERIRAIFQKLGFFSLLRRLNEDTKPAAMQGALPAIAKKEKTKIQTIETPDEFKKRFFKKAPEDLGLIIDGGALYLVTKDGSAFLLKEMLLRGREIKGFFEAGEFFINDGKSVIRFFHKHGIGLGKIKFDIAIAAYLTSVLGRDFSFAAIATRALGRLISRDIREEFGHFFEIVHLLEAKLQEGRIRKVLEEIELPLMPILAEMEERGIRVDTDFLKKLARKVDAGLEALIKEIYKLSGESFNINSSQQLSRILFEALKIKTHGLRKTPKGGVVSTGAAELEKLKSAHPIVRKILEYRELAKLKSTYIDALPLVVDPETGRIHTTFNQTGTATGRLSSSNPNLQNIPVVTELGREVRKAFVAEKGFLLASFDYSQIELRVAAHIANDKKMVDAFRKGLDIHKLAAAEIYNISLDKVTPDLRRAAKTLNFGILYGMGAQALAESTGMSREDAKKFINEYFHDFSGIRNYIERTKQFVEENGYVETIFGRRRYIPEIHSPNWQLKREAERMAINMPIQGSATGDIIKLAMIKVDEWIQKEKLENEVRMLLQVHDELLFEIRGGLVKAIAPKIKKIMEGVAKLKVPLVVDIKVGNNWGEQRALGDSV